jgi:heterodisulfide reductase subunit C
MPSLSLRALVLAETGQDVRRCSHCDFCNLITQDISLQMLMQMVLMNHEEVLTTRTLWSDEVLQSAQHACSSNLNMKAVLLALRAEAARRGVKEEK